MRCGVDLSSSAPRVRAGASQPAIDERLEGVAAGCREDADYLRQLLAVAARTEVPRPLPDSVRAADRRPGSNTAWVSAEQFDRAVVAVRGRPRTLLVHVGVVEVPAARRDAHRPSGQRAEQLSAADYLPMLIPRHVLAELASRTLPFRETTLRRHLATLTVARADGCGVVPAAARLGWRSESGWFRMKRMLTAEQLLAVDDDITALLQRFRARATPFGPWRRAAAAAVAEVDAGAVKLTWGSAEEVMCAWSLWERMHGDDGLTFPFRRTLGVNRQKWLRWASCGDTGQKACESTRFSQLVESLSDSPLDLPLA